MIDREQIIKDFEHAVNKAHGEDYDYVDLTVEDADKILKLLKEQEALPIVYETNKYTGLPVAHCPSCGEYLVQFHSGVDGKESRFCYYCGQEVKWE